MNQHVLLQTCTLNLYPFHLRMWFELSISSFIHNWIHFILIGNIVSLQLTYQWYFPIVFALEQFCTQQFPFSRITKKSSICWERKYEWCIELCNIQFTNVLGTLPTLRTSLSLPNNSIFKKDTNIVMILILIIRIVRLSKFVCYGMIKYISL